MYIYIYISKRNAQEKKIEQKRVGQKTQAEMDEAHPASPQPSLRKKRTGSTRSRSVDYFCCAHAQPPRPNPVLLGVKLGSREHSPPTALL